jgi:hypothetical protein
MGFLADIIADVLLLLGLFLFRWCRAHKQATLAILVIIMMVLDVIFILWRFDVLAPLI